MRTFVISDLHVGAGPLEDCDDVCESRLAAFVDRLSSLNGEVELVLNGDTFDFVQAEPWRGPGLEGKSATDVPLCFNRATSVAKASSIVNAHPRLMQAWQRYLQRAGKRLTVMPGNHDVDLYWPEVRDIFEAALAGGKSAGLRWHMDRVYRPSSAPHIWIEHGHQFDPANSFFAGPPGQQSEYWAPHRQPILFDGTTGEQRLYECGGTRFLIRFLNELDLRYPFVDNMKPFGKFLGIYFSSLNNLHGGSVTAALTALAFFRYAFVETATNPRALLDASRHADVGTLLMALDAASDGQFNRAMSNAGLGTEMSFKMRCQDPKRAAELLDLALEHAELLQTVRINVGGKLGLGARDGTLTLAKGFNIDETQLLRRGAQDILKAHSDVRIVVMGHTHESVDEPSYKNTGSWTRYWQLPATKAPTWQQMVELAPNLPMSPKFAAIDASAGTASLRLFDEGTAL